MSGGSQSQSNNPTEPVAISNQVDDEVEVLCDAGAGNLPFLRRYDFSAGSPPVITNTTLDGVTPYAVVGPVARCTAAAITNRRDADLEIVCDTVGPFLRRYTVDDAGAVTTVSTTLDGVTPYVPVGAVTKCAEFTDGYAVLCDSTPTTFLRRYRVNAVGTLTVTNLTLAGGAFVPVGAVGLCPGALSVTNRRDLFDEILCDTVGPFLRRYTMNDAGVVSIVNTTLDGTTAYVPVGAVAKCTEVNDGYVVLCDNNGPFLRRVRTNQVGTITVTNLTLAGGAYVPVGTVFYCGGRNATSLIISRPNGAAGPANTRVTSTLARRVTIIWENNSALAARPTVNGVALYSTGTGGGDADPSWFSVGDLATGGTLPAITVVCNEAGDDMTVIEEL